MVEKNSFLKSSVVMVVGRVAILAFGLLFSPLLVRVLSKEEYGIFAAVIAIFSIMELVSNVGLFDSVRKHMASSTDGRDQTDIVYASYLLGLVYGVLSLVLIVVAAVSLLSGQRSQLLIILGVAMIGNNIYRISRSAFHGRQQEQYAILFNVLQNAVYFVAGLGLGLFFGVVGVIVGNVLSFYAAAVVGTIYVNRHFQKVSLQFDRVKHRFRPLATYGATQMVGGVAVVILYKVDILLINYFLGATETASYQAAIIPAEFVWFIPSAVQTVVLQNVATHWSNDDVKQIDHNLTAAVKWSALFLILVCIGLFGLAEPFITLYYGENYLSSVAPLRILLFGTFFFGVARIFIPALQAIGWIKYTESLHVVVLVLNVALNAALIPMYGITGAAVATSASYALVLVGGLVIWHRSSMSFRSRSFPLRAGATAALFLAGYMPVVSWIQLPPLPKLLVCPPLGLLLFLVAATVTGALTRQDYRLIWSKIRDVLDR